jgi:pimeloyl-ACP methyl ester carboxylesterase
MTTLDLRKTLNAFSSEARLSELATPRYRMRYWSWGDGPPLVIVHGLNDVPRSFVPLMKHLCDAFRCIAIQLPEGGQDGAALHRYRHEDFTRDLVALFDHLNLESTDLLGSSFGTTIAIHTAATFPNRIRRLVLQGGFAHRPLSSVERFLAYLGQSWPWRMGALPIRPRVMRRLEAPGFAAAPDMIDFLLENSAITPIRAATHRARILQTLDLRPLLAQIPHSVLLIGGDRDAIVPRSCEATLEASLRDVRRVEFSPCGHYPQYAHPRGMAAAIREHLPLDRSRH